MVLPPRLLAKTYTASSFFFLPPLPLPPRPAAPADLLFFLALFFTVPAPAIANKSPDVLRYSDFYRKNCDRAPLSTKRLKEDAAKYAHKLKTTTCQGGYTEVHAISRFLARKIILHVYSGGDTYLQHDLYDGVETAALPPLHILFKNRHYTALVEVN